MQAEVSAVLVEPLRAQLAAAMALHEADLAQGLGVVWLPDALARKYPDAQKSWGWQYVFPARGISIDPHSGERCRHHIDEKLLQRAMKKAVAVARLAKPATPHTLRHSFATLGVRKLNATRAQIKCDKLTLHATKLACG